MKKLKVIVACMVLVITVGYCYLNMNKNNLEDNTYIKNENTVSMLLETASGSGEYVESNSSTYPTSGYVFNSILSKCENGGELSWNNSTKKVVFSGITSNKCYIYFDKE